MFKIIVAIHVFLYRLTGGKLGGNFSGNNILLFMTKGRKTGKERVNPLMYIQDGNQYAISASAGGDAKHPGWYWNAVHGTHPVQIQVMDRIMTVNITETEGAQRDEWYARFKKMSENFAAYEKKTDRTIPVLLLTPEA